MHYLWEKNQGRTTYNGFPIYNEIIMCNEDVELCKRCYNFLPYDIQKEMHCIINSMSAKKHVKFF